MQPKVLIISGPTATGKTKLALALADQFNGEIVSADSRHVYIGMDVVTGKDIPPGFTQKKSGLVWHGRELSFFENGVIRIWLVDIVQPDEDFNVSFWRECADLIISDIHHRGKLPIITGGTGLYIKSLLTDLSSISIPPNLKLREKLKNMTVVELLNYLNQIDLSKAVSLNPSDRANPRRLIRAIEIASSNSPSHKLGEGVRGVVSEKQSCNFLTLGLSADLPVLLTRIQSRLKDRIKAGAFMEAEKLTKKYSSDLPAMTACGYADFGQSDWETAWFARERHLVKKQLTWFKKQPDIHWFDIAKNNWQCEADKIVHSWYNKTHA